MGEIETSDSAGVVAGTAERLPTEMYLRDSPLAHVNGALRAFAAEAAAGAEDPARRPAPADERGQPGHDLRPAPDRRSRVGGGGLRAQARTARATSPTSSSPARAPSARRRASSTATARPKRRAGEPGAHAWAEAHAPGLGWVAFDPTACICADRALCPRRGRLRRPRRPVRQRRPRHGGGHGRKRHPDRAGGVPDAGVRRFALFEFPFEGFQRLAAPFSNSAAARGRESASSDSMSSQSFTYR